MPNLEHQRLTVIWQNQTLYDAAVEQFRAGIVQKYVLMIQQLREAGLMSADDAIALAVPDVKLAVSDRRAIRAPALGLR